VDSLVIALGWAGIYSPMALGAIGWYGMVYHGSQAGVLAWVALPYALLLAGTAGLAAGLAIQAPILLPLAVGAALFLWPRTRSGRRPSHSFRPWVSR